MLTCPAPVPQSIRESSIPSAVRLTAPADVSKCAELNEATPLFDVEASSPAIVMVLSVTVVSIPSPPENVMVSPVLTESLLPLSAAILNVLTTVPNDKLPAPSVFKN